MISAIVAEVCMVFFHVLFTSYINPDSYDFPGPVDIRETIQRELEKEMIREKIIAEEVERFHVLEAEVRRELMIGREMMAMKRRSGYPSSSFMLRSDQPGEVKEITTSLPKVAKVSILIL
uniref:Uncharacterized protein n=1 Tax=Lactuca sativa TaxID=4236 RepID=A0A9R1VIA0_LACSA|nr:hypothetical protein LSAT_V11C500261210 [Lactuca sativa]